MKNKFVSRVLSSFAVIAATIVCAQSAQADELPSYTPEKVSKAIVTSVGSDSMSPLLASMVEGYRNVQPKVTVEILGRGSASAPNALRDGRASLGPMARPMKPEELRAFTSEVGYPPTRVRVAAAATAVYVSTKNPVNELTFEQLDAIYSQTLTRGSAHPAHLWGDIGVQGAIGSRKILPISYTINSYHWHYFRQQVMLQGEFASHVRPVASVRAVVDLLSTNPQAIVFGPVGIKADNVKAVAISRMGEHFILPGREAILEGEYPLARFLNVYVDKKPDESVDLAALDFVRFMLSAQGQGIARTRGFVPLSREIVLKERQKLQKN